MLGLVFDLANGADRGPARLPTPRAGNLLRAMVPVAAIAVGALLAFGPYLHTTRLMKGTLLTVPGLASLAAFRALTRPTGSKGEKLSNLFDQLSMNTMIDFQYGNKSNETLLINKIWEVDVHRQMGRSYFDFSKPGDKVEKRAYEQLEVSSAQPITDLIVELQKRGFSEKEITALSKVWHQGTGNYLVYRLHSDYEHNIRNGQMLMPSDTTQFTGEGYKTISKIYWEADAWVVDCQMIAKLARSPTEENEDDIYLLSQLTVNLATADGVRTCQAFPASSKDQIEFDYS